MANKGERGPQGIPGPPGPTGTRGARGAKGATGKAGATGSVGGLERRKLLRNVNNQIEDIYRELDIQLTRMAQIQQQLDELRATLKKLSVV